MSGDNSAAMALPGEDKIAAQNAAQTAKVHNSNKGKTLAKRKPARKGAGRPTKFRPEMLGQITDLAMLGKTDEQIAGLIGITPQTLCEWRKNFPRISEALARGRTVADADIAGALYKRAIGMRVTEVREDPRGTITTTKEVPPDTSAAVFWLKNRQSAHWTDRQEQSITVKQELDTMSLAELRAHEEELARRLEELGARRTIESEADAVDE